MKKKISLVLMLIMLLSVSVLPAAGNKTDVMVSDVIDIEGHWAENQMTHLVGMGITRGYPTTYYDPITGQYIPGKKLQPNTKITRAEFAVMMYQALNLTKADRQAPFKDMSNAPVWAKEALNSLYDEGIMLGSNGYIKPNANIKRAEIAAMIVKGLHDKSEVTNFKSFPDVSSTDWFYYVVQKAADMGIIKGKPDGSFAPNSYASRGEVMTMLYNMLSKDKSDTSSDSSILTVTDEYINKSEQIFAAGSPYDLFSLSDLLTGSEAAALAVNNEILNALAEEGQIDYEVLSEGTVVNKSDWTAEVKYQTRFTFTRDGESTSFDLTEHLYLMNIKGEWLIYYIPSQV